MLLGVLFNKVKWFEWLFVAAFAVLLVTVTIYGYKLKISQLELKESQLLQKAAEIERDFLRASRIIDEKITNKALNEIENIVLYQNEEKVRFHDEYLLLLETPPTNDPDEIETPKPPVITTTEVQPSELKHVVLQQPTNEEPKEKTTIKAKKKPPTLDNDRARVKLIASRLHNAWTCSQGTLSSCTT